MITKTGATFLEKVAVAKWKRELMSMDASTYKKILATKAKKPIDYVNGINRGSQNIIRNAGFDVLDLDSKDIFNNQAFRRYVNEVNTFNKTNKSPHEVLKDLMSSAGKGGFYTHGARIGGDGRLQGYIFHRGFDQYAKANSLSGNNAELAFARSMRHEAEEAKALSRMDPKNTYFVSYCSENGIPMSTHASPKVLAAETRLINQTPGMYEASTKLQTLRLLTKEYKALLANLTRQDKPLLFPTRMNYDMLGKQVDFTNKDYHQLGKEPWRSKSKNYAKTVTKTVDYYDSRTGEPFETTVSNFTTPAITQIP